MAEQTSHGVGVTDPSAQAGDVKQTTWAEMEEMVNEGRILEALRIRGEQMGLEPVPTHDEQGRRLFYSITESNTVGSELGWGLARYLSGHANGPLDRISWAEASLGHPAGTWEGMREAQNDPRNLTRGAAARTAREVYELARVKRDMEDLREVGHFSTNSGGIAARTERGDYLIGFDTPATRKALEEAGYRATDPDHKLGVPFSNNQDRNRQIREALGHKF